MSRRGKYAPARGELALVLALGALTACGGGSGGGGGGGGTDAGFVLADAGAHAAADDDRPEGDGGFADTPVDLVTDRYAPRDVAADGASVYWIETQTDDGHPAEVIERYDHSDEQTVEVGGLLDDMGRIVFDAEHFYVNGGLHGQPGIFQFSKTMDVGTYRPIVQKTGVDADHSPALDGANVFWMEVDGMGGLDVWASSAAHPAPAKLFDLATPSASALEADETSLYFIHQATIAKAPKAPASGMVTPTIVVPADEDRHPIDRFHVHGDSVYFIRDSGFWRMKKDGTGAPALLYRPDPGETWCVRLQPGFVVFGGYLYWTTTCTLDGDAQGVIRRVAIDGGTPETVVSREPTEPTSLALDRQGLYWTYDLTLSNGEQGGRVRMLPFR